MVFQKMFFPFFERQISKFDKHMVLNWATQPLTRHLFPVDFFQNPLESANGFNWWFGSRCFGYLG